MLQLWQLVSPPWENFRRLQQAGDFPPHQDLHTRQTYTLQASHCVVLCGEEEKRMLTIPRRILEEYRVLPEDDRPWAFIAMYHDHQEEERLNLVP